MCYSIWMIVKMINNFKDFFMCIFFDIFIFIYYMINSCYWNICFMGNIINCNCIICIYIDLIFFLFENDVFIDILLFFGNIFKFL